MPVPQSMNCTDCTYWHNSGPNFNTEQLDIGRNHSHLLEPVVSSTTYGKSSSGTYVMTNETTPTRWASHVEIEKLTPLEIFQSPKMTRLSGTNIPTEEGTAINRPIHYSLQSICCVLHLCICWRMCSLVSIFWRPFTSKEPKKVGNSSSNQIQIKELLFTR